MSVPIGVPAAVVEGVDEIASAITRRTRRTGLPTPILTRFGADGDVPAAVLVSGTAEETARGFVAAAVDDDTCPGGVIRYAAAQARRLGVSLRAVHVWTGRAKTPHGTRMPWSDQVSGADRLLSQVLYDHLPTARADATEREILHDADVARALVALSAEAALIVVAARSTPLTGGEPLGQTVRELVGRTACPLAVLPPGPDRPGHSPR